MELSKKGTGIISQSFKIQQYLFKIRRLRQKKFLPTAFLKGNYARVCPYGQEHLIKPNVTCTGHDLCTRIMNNCSTWNGKAGQFIINLKRFVQEVLLPNN